MDNTKHLEKLLKVFNADNIITPEEIDQVLAGITAVLSTFKGETEKLNSDTQKRLERLLVEVEKKHEKVLKTVDKTVSLDNKKLSSSFDAKIKEINSLIEEVKNTKPKDGLDGKDADPAEIVPLVLEQIKLPEYKEVVLDNAEQIKNKLESLEKDERLDVSAIKGITALQDRIVEHATTQARGILYAGLLENNSGGGYTNLTEFVDQTAWRVFYSNGSGDVTELALGADGTFLKSNGATSAPSFAVPAGSGDVTKVGTPVNNQIGVWTGDGTIEGDSALTFDTTTDTLATTNITATTVTAALVGNASTATTLQTARTIGGVSFDGSANITVATATGGFTVSGGNLALTTNSITMTGSIAATGARVTKGWFTDIESTNIPTVGGTAILTSLTAPQFTTIELGHASDTTLSRASAGNLAIEGNLVYRAGGTDVPVTDGGTGLSAITALSIWVANSANTITEVTPGAGKSIRINAGGTAWEAYTPGSGGAVAIGDTITSATEGSVLFAGAAGVLAQDNTNFFWDDTNNNLKLGNPSLISTAKLNIKVTTGNSYNLFLEGTGGVIVPTIGFKHSSDTNGVALTGDDTGFGFSNIGEGQTLFMKPGYPDAYWKTHGSLAAKFHFQSHDGSAYVDSMVITGGWAAFGHNTPDRLTHAEVADSGTNTVVYASRLGHVTSGTATTSFGVGQEYELENASGTNKVVATQEWLFTDATNASEDADYVLKLMDAGTLAERFRVTSDGVVELITGANIRVNSANAKRTLVLTSAGGAPTTTAGCSAVTQVESTTNDVNYFVLDFDTTTSENAFWTVQMPDNYDGGTLTARFVWTNAAGLTTETVRWGIKGRAYADSDAIDQAWGTEVTVDDTWLAQNDVHISGETSAITLAGSPAGGQWVAFNVARKTASDNLTGDARLIAVKIEYGINAYSD